jgi:hypothetical protein
LSWQVSPPKMKASEATFSNNQTDIQEDTVEIAGRMQKSRRKRGITGTSPGKSRPPIA